EIAVETANHLELLVVLLAKVGTGWSDEIEQDGDDGGDALEMTGAPHPFPLLGETPHRHRRGESRRIDASHTRGENEIRPGTRRQCGVPIEIARVPLQVGRIVKLGRVDEDA